MVTAHSRQFSLTTYGRSNLSHMTGDKHCWLNLRKQAAAHGPTSAQDKKAAVHG